MHRTVHSVNGWKEIKRSRVISCFPTVSHLSPSVAKKPRAMGSLFTVFLPPSSLAPFPLTSSKDEYSHLIFHELPALPRQSIFSQSSLPHLQARINQTQLVDFRDERSHFLAEAASIDNGTGRGQERDRDITEGSSLESDRSGHSRKLGQSSKKKRIEPVLGGARVSGLRREVSVELSRRRSTRLVRASGEKLLL